MVQSWYLYRGIVLQLICDSQVLSASCLQRGMISDVSEF